MPLARPSAPSPQAGTPAFVADKTLSMFPVLLSYLVDDVYEDGGPRERSAVSIFVEGAVVKLALNDKAAKRSLYVASDGLLGAFKALERLLESGEGEWRQWNARTKKK